MAVQVSDFEYEMLIRYKEQLEILKKFIKQDKVITKSEIITLIDAMEAENE